MINFLSKADDTPGIIRAYVRRDIRYFCCHRPASSVIVAPNNTTQLVLKTCLRKLFFGYFSQATLEAACGLHLQEISRRRF